MSPAATAIHSRPEEFLPSLYRAQVLSQVRTFLKKHVDSEHQYGLLERALLHLDLEEGEGDIFPYIYLPRLVFLGIKGEEGRSLDLAVVTTLLFLGIDILDDLADGDLPAHWEGCLPSEISLVAATLLSALPQIAISELDVSSDGRDEMQRILATGLLRMSAGQHEDLRFCGTSRTDSQSIESSVMSKSGEEVAMFAALSARFAGASQDLIETYAAMGKFLGTAAQLASDGFDLFQAKHSKDLANGTRTLPIALYLEGRSEDERESFLSLIGKARQDPSARQEIRQRLQRAGILRFLAVIVELYCQKALREVEKAMPQGPADEGLRQMIHQISFFQNKEDL